MPNITTSIIKARAEQVCQLCGGTIKPGEHYHRFNIGRGNIKVCQKRHPIKIKAEGIVRD